MRHTLHHPARALCAMQLSHAPTTSQARLTAANALALHSTLVMLPRRFQHRLFLAVRELKGAEPTAVTAASLQGGSRMHTQDELLNLLWLVAGLLVRYAYSSNGQQWSTLGKR